jgi:hypothetical protein
MLKIRLEIISYSKNIIKSMLSSKISIFEV